MWLANSAWFHWVAQIRQTAWYKQPPLHTSDSLHKAFGQQIVYIVFLMYFLTEVLCEHILLLWSWQQEGGSEDHFYTSLFGNQSKEEARNSLITLWTSNQKKKMQAYTFVIPCPKCSKTVCTSKSWLANENDFADLLSCQAHFVEWTRSNGKAAQYSRVFHQLQWPVPRLHALSATLFMFYTTIFDTAPDPGTGQTLVLVLQHKVSQTSKILIHFNSLNISIHS